MINYRPIPATQNIRRKQSPIPTKKANMKTNPLKIFIVNLIISFIDFKDNFILLTLIITTTTTRDY